MTKKMWESALPNMPTSSTPFGIPRPCRTPHSLPAIAPRRRFATHRLVPGAKWSYASAHPKMRPSPVQGPSRAQHRFLQGPLAAIVPLSMAAARRARDPPPLMGELTDIATIRFAGEWEIAETEVADDIDRGHEIMNRAVDETGVSPKRSDREAAA